ncbi:5'/3'-nucleotidase SurE [Tumebacillus lipolyticus]|uniref:5'-nucleotidase SurE n=1 Tax=Tumebacillus lipolyticus TaxID=1280370 RepID=A0ABW4ZT77_9BACL
MRILISNDDGVQAEGIRVLAERLKTVGKVVVVAPDRQRSAAGHGITLHRPLFVNYHKLCDGVDAYGVSGTPADCVKLGVNEIMKDARPDLIVSGINEGSNLGSDVMYSGTVSAAIEGAVQGIPSIAVSQCGHSQLDYAGAADFTAKLITQVMKNGLNKDTVLNVNYPALKPDAVKGVRITKLGERRYHNIFEKHYSPRGEAYYWLAGDLKDLAVEPDSDIQAIIDGYVTVSPVHFDFTHFQLMDDLRNWTLD